MTTTQTNSKGVFHLGAFPDLEADFSNGSDGYFGIARKEGFATTEFEISADRQGQVVASVKLRPAASLRGSVIDGEGNPIPGASVSTMPEFIEGYRSAVTNDQGEFEIADLAELHAEFFRQGGTLQPKSRLPLRVSHPEYGVKTVWYWECPSSVEIRLAAPAIVEGRVVGRRGEPLAEIAVWLQGCTAKNWEAPPASAVVAITDPGGRFSFRLQGVKAANLFVDDPRYVAAAIDSLPVASGEITSAPDLRAAKGGIVTGRVTDVATGRPVLLEPGDRLWIFAHSPARPASGAAVQGTLVQPDGTYRLRVAEGNCQPYFGGSATRSGKVWRVIDGPKGTPDSQISIAVKEGQTSEMHFRVAATVK